jgi:hypothetical protein
MHSFVILIILLHIRQIEISIFLLFQEKKLCENNGKICHTGKI